MEGAIHKVTSSNSVIFRQPFIFVRSQAIEWRHYFGPPSPLLSVHTLWMFAKEINSKNCKKIINFPILKETQPTIIWPIWVFTSLGVAFFRVTLRDRVQTFVENEQFTKMIRLNLFFFSLHGSNVKSGKKMWYEKIFFILCDFSYSGS